MDSATELTRARAFALKELGRINDQLSSQRRNSARAGEVVEAAMTITKATERATELYRMLEAFEALSNRLQGE